MGQDQARVVDHGAPVGNQIEVERTGRVGRLPQAAKVSLEAGKDRHHLPRR